MEVERILKDFKNKILGVILLILTCFPNIALPEDFALSKIASLSKPCGLSFINESELLITERTGKIKIVNIYNGEVLEIQHNLNFKNKGQGGLLDIIYKDNQVWISYTEKIGFLKYGTSVAKGKFSRKEMIFNSKMYFPSLEGLHSTQTFCQALTLPFHIIAKLPYLSDKIYLCSLHH